MNHIPDTSKMVSDTPRTNAMLTAILETHGHVGFLNCPPAWVAFSRELERELNAAKQHIMLLEKAVDEMHRFCDAISADKWTKAKETKP